MKFVGHDGKTYRLRVMENDPLSHRAATLADLRAAEHLGDCCPDCDRLRPQASKRIEELEAELRHRNQDALNAWAEARRLRAQLLDVRRTVGNWSEKDDPYTVKQLLTHLLDRYLGGSS